jgi:hypothetical protein
MTDADRQPFTLALHKLALGVGYTLTDEVVGAYREGLSDWPLARVRLALWSCARSCHQWPSLGEIRESGRGDHAPGSQTPTPVGNVSCEVCEGRGWVSVEVQHSGQLVRLARRCSCRRVG